MSKGWAGGSTRAWRKYRASRLPAGAPCELRLPECTGIADTLHHLDGVKAGLIPTDPTRCIPACTHCNSSTGEPTTTDVRPNPPRTDWG